MAMFGSQARNGGEGVNTLADGSELRLELYKSDGCPYCQRVFASIDRLNVAIEYRDVNQGGHRADHVKRTGRQTVPCLYVNDEPMFESGDIIAWLNDRFSAR